MKTFIFQKSYSACILFVGLILAAPSGALGAEPAPENSASIPHSAHALKPFTITLEHKKVELGLSAQYLEDQNRKRTIEELRSTNSNLQWKPSSNSTPNFGYSKSAHWIRVALQRSQAANPSRILQINFAVLDEIQFYLFRNGQLEQRVQTGDHSPFKQRPVWNRNFLFPFEIGAHERVEIYIRVASTSAVQIPLLLWEEKAFARAEQTVIATQAAYYGLMLIMTLFNVFLYLSTRERVYLYYFCFILACGLFGFARRGFGFQYLWPDSTTLQATSAPFLLSAFISFSLLFTVEFLQFKQTMPLAKKLCLWLAWACAIPAIFALLGHYALAVQTTLFFALLALPMLVIIPPILAYHGQSEARQYTVAFAILILGACLHGLKHLSILPTNFFTENAMLMGSALQVTLLSMALGLRLQALKKEQIKTELQAEHTRQKLLKSEQRAKEQRKKHEQFAIETEKMVQLGKLTSSIGHEVNNPAQTVTLCLTVAKNLIGEISDLIRNEVSAKISQRYETQTATLLQMLDHSLMSIKGLTEMTSALTRQSRAGETQVETVDINQMIDESLVLCKGKITVFTVRFNQRESSYVEAVPVRLCQVFINLFSNAADALETHSQALGEGQQEPFTGVIEISTRAVARAEQMGIEIQINDNGGGIPQEVMAHIFDEYYTTKKRGDGTGLGLHLAKSIIQEFHGEITVQNNPDFGGAEFKIWLPTTPATTSMGVENS